MTDIRSIDLNETRVCRVDPVSGEELPSLDKTRVMPKGNHHFDATVQAAHPYAEPPATSAFVAEYVPITSHGASGDATALWTPTTAQLQKVAAWFSRNRRRIILLLVSVVIAIAVPFATLQANSDDTTPRHSLRRKKSTPPNQPSPRKSDTEVITGATAIQAATWLNNGDYKKARAAYSFLAKRHPENKSYTLAKSILENQEEYQ
ncbi:MAG: hypothetical protein JXR76_02300 [Deltaproteobacteria bacterium]|nr:hypothetical protein [Deltaproteobacteria bacterium]